MQIRFKLGLRTREITLLLIQQIATLYPPNTDFKLLDAMSLPGRWGLHTTSLSISAMLPALT